MNWQGKPCLKIGTTVSKNLDSTTVKSSQWQEYQDAGKGNYRAAQIINHQLETVIFIAADNDLPERNWLTSLFAKNN